jgi:hypothetical protein
MNYVEINRFIKRLEHYKGRIPTHQIKTLRGQALAGDLAGAKKGLERLCSTMINKKACNVGK